MRPAAAAAAPTLIDYAVRQIPAPDIRAAGHAGVINYVSTSRPGSSFGAQPITLPYARSTFFSVDDINRETSNNVVLQWFRGVNAVIGVQRTGIYGGIKARRWAIVATTPNPGPLVGAIEVDVNEVLAQDCGRWNLHP